ncbi:UNVERIFIED_ORG: hypothetical protein J2811_006877 [Burkholderia cepacia]|nr:hypothetical protein [Burkholderia cepacia]MDP9673347.1 hypothetical protein [Burkholderia cepacia]MDP9720435.1 hypothetical protein [Burkholderia cepacia]RAS40663.1 hypothetical protein DFS07_13071 [Burkholderia cenocepacia]
MDRSQQISRNHQIRQSEQAEQLRGVLGQALVSGLAMLKQILDDMKRMLNPRTDLRLGSLERNMSAFLWARRLNNRLSACLRESLAEQDSKLVHR